MQTFLILSQSRRYRAFRSYGAPAVLLVLDTENLLNKVQKHVFIILYLMYSVYKHLMNAFIQLVMWRFAGNKMTLNRTENYREEVLKQFQMLHNPLCISVIGTLWSVSDNSKKLLFWGHVLQHLLNIWVMSISKWKTPCFVQWQRRLIFLVWLNNNSSRDKDVVITQLFMYRRYLV